MRPQLCCPTATVLSCCAAGPSIRPTSPIAFGQKSHGRCASFFCFLFFAVCVWGVTARSLLFVIRDGANMTTVVRKRAPTRALSNFSLTRPIFRMAYPSFPVDRRGLPSSGVAPATPPSVAGSLPTAATTPRPLPEASISSSSRARIPAVLPEPRPAKLLQQPRSSLPLRVELFSFRRSSPTFVSRLERSSAASRGPPSCPARAPARSLLLLPPALPGPLRTFSLHGLVLSSTVSSGSIGLDPESVASCGAPSCLARVSSRGPLLRDRQPSGSVPLSSFSSSPSPPRCSRLPHDVAIVLERPLNSAGATT